MSNVITFHKITVRGLEVSLIYEMPYWIWSLQQNCKKFNTHSFPCKMSFGNLLIYKTGRMSLNNENSIAKLITLHRYFVLNRLKLRSNAVGLEYHYSSGCSKERPQLSYFNSFMCKYWWVVLLELELILTQPSTYQIGGLKLFPHSMNSMRIHICLISNLSLML